MLNNRPWPGYEGFEVLMAVTMKSTVLWDVTPCNLVAKYSRFTETCCLHFQGLPNWQSMSMDTVPYIHCYAYVHTKKKSHVLLLCRLLSGFITELENGCLCIRYINPNISQIWIYYCKLKTVKPMWCGNKKHVKLRDMRLSLQ